PAIRHTPPQVRAAQAAGRRQRRRARPPLKQDTARKRIPLCSSHFLPRSARCRELIEIVDAHHAFEPCYAVDQLLEAVLAEPFPFVMLELLGDGVELVAETRSRSFGNSSVSLRAACGRYDYGVIDNASIASSRTMPYPQILYVAAK